MLHPVVGALRCTTSPICAAKHTSFAIGAPPVLPGSRLDSRPSTRRPLLVSTSRSLDPHQASRCAPPVALLDSLVTSLTADSAAQATDLSSVSLDALGRDLLIFLSASVIVRPVARLLNVNPILLFLLIGALLGPHGLNVFANTEADVEIGDFGVLFLLFAEGLEASPERLSSLTKYLPLGLSQLGLTTALFTGLILLFSSSGELGWVSEWIERYIPLDQGFVDISNPGEALVLSLAATLSSSAFVFPVLQAKGWENRPSGVAGKATLLLQDLAVAPVLVLLPFILGSGKTDWADLGILLTKATFGFGAVLFAGSYVLRYVFQAVADAQATESFVALVVLVAVGMGIIAEQLGLTNTAGAFAAGVLLANTNFRAQIQADIVPFEGILLGIFFMTTGSNFDAFLLLSAWPTVLTATFLLLFVKAGVLAISSRVGGLPLAEGVRMSLLLAGGGEFAFVIFGLGERLGVLPSQFNGLLTGVVLISMSITPLLAEAAAALSAPLVRQRDDMRDGPQTEITDEKWDAARTVQVAGDAFVVCGYGELGRAVFRTLKLTLDGTASDIQSMAPDSQAASSQLVAFELKPTRVIQGVLNNDTVIYGDAANVELLRAAGVTEPRAIFVTYSKLSRCLSTVGRLRKSFPDARIFSRATSDAEVDALLRAGASECVDASEETAVQLSGCLGVDAASEQSLRLLLEQQHCARPWTVNTTAEALRSASLAAGVSERTARRVYSLYNALDANNDGVVSLSEVTDIIERAELDKATRGLCRPSLQRCVNAARAEGEGVVDFEDFLKVYADDRALWTQPSEPDEAENEMTELDRVAAMDAGLTESEAVALFELYISLNRDDGGEVDIAEIRNLLSKTTLGIRSDRALDTWLEDGDEDGDGRVDFASFLRYYSVLR